MNNNTAFDAAGPVKPFDIVEITGNYKAHPHPQTGERMKKGHLGLVLSVDGGTMCVRPFGYPYTAEFTAEELSIKHSMGLRESEVLKATLRTSKYFIAAYKDTHYRNLVHDLDDITVVGLLRIALERVITHHTKTPPEG